MPPPGPVGRRAVMCRCVSIKTVRTTLDLAEDVMAAARELAQAEGRSLGAVVSDLARRGLTPARVERQHGRPVLRSPAGAPPITLEMVRRALDEH